jgi:sec-independent protein translocase protein TatC
MAVSRKFLALGDPDPKNMTVIEHLEELRSRLIVCILVTTVAAIVGLFFYEPIFSLLTRPLNGIHTAFGSGVLTFNTVTGALFMRIKLALIPAAIISVPVWLYELWMFVAPALEIETRQYVVPFVALGLVLFLLGAGVGYLVFPRYFGFMVGIAGPKFLYIPDAASYLSTFAILLLVFGAVFELPIVLVLLSRIGMVSSAFLRRRRKVSFFVALFAGMIITPGADPITPLIVSFLLMVLYEFSIILIRLGHR